MSNSSLNRTDKMFLLENVVHNIGLGTDDINWTDIHGFYLHDDMTISGKGNNGGEFHHRSDIHGLQGKRK
jgi:hypothetical protein